MRGLAGKLWIAAILTAVSLYIVSPFWTAWSIREAVKSGDVATLRSKVDWNSVRPALRESIARHAQLLPAAVDVGRAIQPTLWQRIKFLFGETMLDRFMARYISPQGLPQLYQLKQGYRTRIKGLENEDLLPLRERVRRFLRRIRRAEFVSLTLVEIEVADRDDPTRHVVGTMSLVGFEWKLTGIRVKDAQPQRSDSDGHSIAGDDGSVIIHDEDRQVADDLKNGHITVKERTGA